MKPLRGVDPFAEPLLDRPDVDPGSWPRATHRAPMLSLLGLRLARARLAAGFSIADVRDFAGINPGSLSRIEHGWRFPPAATLAGLAALYRVDAASLRPPDDGAEERSGRLSPHLGSAEFIHSQNPRFLVRNRRHWLQRPDLRENGRWLAAALFEPVREALGVALDVVGGYRSHDVNRRTLVDEAEFSPHVHALAFDVIPVGVDLRIAMRRLRAAVERGELPHLDFAVVEFDRWIHVQAPAFDRTARGVVVRWGDA